MADGVAELFYGSSKPLGITYESAICGIAHV